MIGKHYTFPRRPKNRLDFAGGFRYAKNFSQATIQIGSTKRYLQVMLVGKKVAGGVSYFHVSFRGKHNSKLVWLRLSNRPSLWLIRLGRWQRPRAAPYGQFLR